MENSQLHTVCSHLHKHPVDWITLLLLKVLFVNTLLKITKVILTVILTTFSFCTMLFPSQINLAAHLLHLIG